MSVVKPTAPVSARFSMSGTIEGSPVSLPQSTVSSPGNWALSHFTELSEPVNPARWKKKMCRFGCRRSQASTAARVTFYLQGRVAVVHQRGTGPVVKSHAGFDPFAEVIHETVGAEVQQIPDPVPPPPHRGRLVRSITAA